MPPAHPLRMITIAPVNLDIAAATVSRISMNALVTRAQAGPVWTGIATTAVAVHWEGLEPPAIRVRTQEYSWYPFHNSG